MRLYILLIAATIVARFTGLNILVFLVLILPVAFLEESRFGIRNRWNLSVLALAPAVYLYGLNYTLSNSVVAFAEEVFFRGYLMKTFSNLTVSAMFVVPHLILYSDIHSILTFFPSLMFGYAYTRTGSILLATVLHTVSNIIYDKLLPALLPQHLENLLRMPVG